MWCADATERRARHSYIGPMTPRVHSVTVSVGSITVLAVALFAFRVSAVLFFVHLHLCPAGQRSARVQRCRGYQKSIESCYYNYDHLHGCYVYFTLYTFDVI
jgi:hypothetical protein